MKATLGNWVVVASCCALSGCLCGYPQTVVGSGEAGSETRTVGAFRTARFEGGVVGTVLGGARNVTVTSDSNLLEYVETLVDGEAFVARTRAGVELAPIVGLKVEAFNDVLEGLELSEGARATVQASAVTTFPLRVVSGSTGTVTGLSSSTLAVTASGQAMAIAAGAAPSVTVTASEASTVDTRDVPATSVSVTASGGSNVRVRASAAVTGTLTGASRLVVTGGATVTVDASSDSTVVEE